MPMFVKTSQVAKGKLPMVTPGMRDNSILPSSGGASNSGITLDYSAINMGGIDNGVAINHSDDKKVFYHGSPEKFDTLRAGSWVTPHKEDAFIFGVPWSSDDLTNTGDETGRPPKKLTFKPGREPEDQPIYLYEINGDVKPAETNTGVKYDWNHQTIKDLPAKIISVLPSWKKELLNKENKVDDPYNDNNKGTGSFVGSHEEGFALRHNLDYGSTVAKLKALIITGNPRFVDGSETAQQFYREIKNYLGKIGYTVHFQSSADVCVPPATADLLIGHSNGLRKLNHYINGGKLLAFGAIPEKATNSKIVFANHPVDEAYLKKCHYRKRYDYPIPEHFIFTDEMKTAIDNATIQLRAFPDYQQYNSNSQMYEQVAERPDAFTTPQFNMWNTYYASDSEYEATPSISDLKTILPQLAQSAQKVYNEWTQDEDDDLNGGGICHLIADAMCEEMSRIGIECATVSYSIGEVHVAAVAKLSDGVYTVDIPPSLYETGGGYTWQKRPDINFTPDYISITKDSSDPDEFENFVGDYASDKYAALNVLPYSDPNMYEQNSNPRNTTEPEFDIFETYFADDGYDLTRKPLQREKPKSEEEILINRGPLQRERPRQQVVETAPIRGPLQRERPRQQFPLATMFADDDDVVEVTEESNDIVEAMDSVGHLGVKNASSKTGILFAKQSLHSLPLVQCDLADTYQKQVIGLQNHNSLGPDAGLLFTYSRPQPLTFWMGKVAFPIDIIFANSDNKIIKIYRNCKPNSTELYSCANASKVIEVVGSFCAFHDIDVGDRVFYADDRDENLTQHVLESVVEAKMEQQKDLGMTDWNIKIVMKKEPDNRRFLKVSWSPEDYKLKKADIFVNPNQELMREALKKMPLDKLLRHALLHILAGAKNELPEDKEQKLITDRLY